MNDRSRPAHPGTELAKLLKRRRMTPYECAIRLNLRPPRIYDICKAKKGLTAAMALRLAKLFGGNAADWLALQARFDLAEAEREHAKELRAIIPIAEDV